MVRSHVNSGCSAATRVKAVSPEIFLIAMGQGLLCSEASIVAGVIRRVCNGGPGSQAAAGHPTDCIGTWESRIACIPQQAEEARRGHGDAAVGSAHIRGVTGVTPGEPYTRWWMALEGAGSQSIRAEKLRAILRCGEPGNNDIALVSRRARVNGDSTGCSARRWPVLFAGNYYIFPLPSIEVG